MKHDNPYHSTPVDAPFNSEGGGAAHQFQQAIEQDVEALVRLELAAEQLLAEEVNLARAYLEEDSQHIWAEIKDGLHHWEQMTGNWLLSAADPSQLNWQLNHWWDQNTLH